MVRVMIRGAVWCKSEDEILKDAVTKHGKRWMRISPLFRKKTATQCQARWYWLHPSIMAARWSREDDQKLLDLVEQIPAELQLIAHIMERTEAQCLERHQYLVNGAQRTGDQDSGSEPITMNTDELERLSEEMVRRAKIQHKQARREAREKHLEEMHRLAFLQKRQELRAAAIERMSQDENANPFEKYSAHGFYTSSETDSKTANMRNKNKAIRD